MASSRKTPATSDLLDSSLSASAHSGVRNTASKSNANFEFDPSGSDDEPGNLVIDLDANLDKSPPLGGGKRSPGKTTSKMNSGHNPFEHQSTVDRGLKMKIKRKSVGSGKLSDSPKGDNKSDLLKSDNTVNNMSGLSGVDKRKLSGSPLLGDKDNKMLGKGRGYKKERVMNIKKNNETVVNGGSSNLFLSPSSNSMFDNADESGMFKRRLPDMATVDPYDFNAKTDDEKYPTGLFTKKIKTEKVEPSSVQLSPPITTATDSRDVGVETCNIGTATEPECLGPCEPGTSVNLEGIVWQETENGMLVVNVTWRGKTFVGTLLDATKHDWAPPRLSCDSPTSDIDPRSTPKGRGKRARGVSATVPLIDMSNYTERKLRKGRRGSGANFQAPPSPAKSDTVPTGAVKRKGRPSELDLSSSNEDLKTAKRSRSCSRSTPVPEPSPNSPVLIECPEPNCNKKYKHINGLRYHQTHAHLTSEGERVSETDLPKDSSEEAQPSSPTPEAKDEKEAAPKEGETTAKKRGPKKKEASVERSKTPPDNKHTTKADKLESKTVVNNTKSEKVKKDESLLTKNKKDTLDTTASPMETISEAKSVTTTTPQVFHISGAPIRSVNSANKVSQSSPTPSVVSGTASAPSTFIPPHSSGHIISTVATVSVPMVTVATMVAPVATITPPVVSESFKSDINSTSKDKKAASKIEKGDKLKQKAVTNRHIVPAPPAKMLNLNASVSVTQSTLAPVSTYSPVNSVGTTTLKPIQPKPTIMGETNAVNPLAGLKDKRLKKKRSKDPLKASKDGDSTADIMKSSKVEGQGRPAPPALIPSKPIEIAPKPAVVSNVHKQDSKDVTAVQNSKKSDTTRTNVPPNTLNIGSPLNVNTPENKTNTDGMTSPAYSDISDEGAPSLDNENRSKSSESKVQPEPISKEPTTVPSYGMYPYYSQPPYLIPAVSPASHSPRSREQSVERGISNTDNVIIKKEPGTSEQRDFTGKPTAVDLQGVEQQSKREEGQPKQPSQQEVFLQHQQMIQQQLFAAGIPQHAHYQYLAQYQYIMAANDPQYRQQYEKFMEDHQKALKENAMAGLQKEASTSGEKEVVKAKATEESRLETRHPATENTRKYDGKKDMTGSVNSPSALGQPPERKVERALQEKKKESHQIMRENIELKSQMDTPSLVPKQVDPYDPAQLVKKQQEDLQRFYMFQRQQQLEHKKVQDIKRHEGGPTRSVPDLKPLDDKGPTVTSKPSSTATLSSINRSESQRDSPNKIRRDDIKQERLTPDHIKRHDAQKTATPLAGKSSQRSDTPKSVRTPPSVAPVPGQVSATFPVFAANPYHFSSFEAGHSMYRAPLMGYNPNSYIHPSQIRYHVPLDVEKDKTAGVGNSPKNMDPAYFGSPNQHKIHELKEQAKSPVNTSDKSNDSSASFEKRRDSSSPPAQRHLHTHHHTHVAYPLYADPYMLAGQPNIPFGAKP